MTFPFRQRVPSHDRTPRWFAWLGLLALAAYGIFIGRHTTIAAGGSDSSGYLNSARLLASGRFEVPVRMPAALQAQEGISPPRFQPLGFVAFEDNARLIPTYPTGFPLHVAAASKVVGWAWGPRLVEIFGALAAVWLCYAVGRELNLSRVLSAAAAVVLAVCPVMIFAAIQPLSDMLATTWCLAAMWAALRARRDRRWAAACGVAFGIAVLVRPTNAVLLPALVVLLGFDWRRLGLAVVGGLPCVAWLAVYNHSLYGGALRSGYFNWSEFFALRYFWPAATFFLKWLVVFLPAVMLILPFAAFGRRAIRSREAWALALWFFPITGLYLFVAFSHEAWTCLRYILPGLPALILAAMLGVDAIARRLSAAGGRDAGGDNPTGEWTERADARARRLSDVAAVGLAVWAIGMSWHWSSRVGVFHIKGHEDVYMTASTAAGKQLPANALVLSCHLSGALFFYTDFPILRWDAFHPGEFERYAEAARRAGLAVTAVLFADEEQPALREVCPGDWVRVGSVGNVGLWRLAALRAEAENR